MEPKEIVEELKNMDKKCHDEFFSGNEQHFPMLYVRYTNEEQGILETFYICQKCFSEWLMKHPEVFKNIMVLRGQVTEECKQFFRRRHYDNEEGDEEE
jgi:hypothetical protein